jgi:S-DNA-T family DNA segregation ATPase FtsK/SpoIIIE
MNHSHDPAQKKAKSTAGLINQNDSEAVVNLWDLFANWILRFERFGWDVLGVAFFVIGLVTLLGLLGLTRGVFLSPWIDFLRRWLGWGSYIIAFSIAWLGLLAVRRAFNAFQVRIPLGRILAIEGCIFVTLILLAIWQGRSLDRAVEGLDGGLVGWGLAGWLESLLPPPWPAGVLIGLLVIFGLYGFGVLTLAVRRFEAWLFAPENPQVGVQSSLSKVDSTKEEMEPETKAFLDRLTDLSKPENKDQVVSWERDVRLPPLNFLVPDQSIRQDDNEIHATAALIEVSLAEFGVPAKVIGFRVGPTVTQFAVEPGYIERTGLDGSPVQQKIRVSQISALSRDLALALSAERLRIEAPVPGHSFVGIEVPNSKSAMVRLRPLLESDAFITMNSPLGLVMGRDVSGKPVVADLSRMPHLLIAGTTGSGKSVCIQAITACLVMNNHPSQLRLAMLDPKMVELVRFNGLPHMMGKVETKTERMIGVLNWALAEMDHRYRLLEGARARDLDGYNKRMTRRRQEILPRIVILIDELADLMMSAPDQTEHSIVRLAQMARATGIHLVVATQRPSTEVVTGLIKANFPARLSFSVASSIDSRVILDGNGAETLLGRGDMLFLNPEAGSPVRAQGVMVSDQEINRIVSFWQQVVTKDKAPPPWEELVRPQEEEGPDRLVDEAIKIVRMTQHASASLLQRRLRVGYPRAARLIDELEELGVVGPSQGGGKERVVLLAPEDDDGFNEDEEDSDL